MKQPKTGWQLNNYTTSILKSIICNITTNDSNAYSGCQLSALTNGVVSLGAVVEPLSWKLVAHERRNIHKKGEIGNSFGPANHKSELQICSMQLCSLEETNEIIVADLRNKRH